MESETLAPKRRAQKQTLPSHSFLDGAIYLYQRGGAKKGKWSIRLKIPNVRGYQHHSSGTADVPEAYRIAKNLYDDALVRSLTNGRSNGKRISAGLKSYIEHHDQPDSALSIRLKVQLARRLEPILEGRHFDELDTALISKMIAELAKRSKKPTLSPNTIKRNLNDFRHFLQWCVDNGYIENIPRFPKIAAEQERRPHFNPEEWKTLKGSFRQYLKDSPKSVRRDRHLLFLYILIMENTGIRVGEARELKWKDIRPVQSENNPEMQNIIISVNGKTGYRDVVCSTSAIIKYLNEIMRKRLQDTKNPESDIFGLKTVPAESYIFCDIKGNKIGSFKRSFRTFVDSINLRKDTHGRSRTIYSLRHTYATSRLEAGVNVYVLAKNMGTSVAMIEKYYGHSSNVAMADELAKPKKKNVKVQEANQVGGSLAWIADLARTR